MEHMPMWVYGEDGVEVPVAHKVEADEVDIDKLVSQIPDVEIDDKTLRRLKWHIRVDLLMKAIRFFFTGRLYG